MWKYHYTEKQNPGQEMEDRDFVGSLFCPKIKFLYIFCECLFL
jgi:hypothetical protein